MKNNSHTVQYTHLKYNSVAFQILSELCCHYHNQLYNIFITSLKTSYLHFFPNPSPGQPVIYSLFLYVYRFTYIGRFIYMKSYNMGPFMPSSFPQSIIFSKFMHVVVGIITSFFINGYYFMVGIYYILLIYLLVDRHLCCFEFWLLWIKMLQWIFVYKVLCGHMFSFLSGICLWVELPDHKINLCITFYVLLKIFDIQKTVHN